MADFYAKYSAAPSGGTVTAEQGTDPWLVAGKGTAGTPAAGVLTVQGVSGGTAIPISGSITATNPSVSATGAAVPADATFIGGSDGTNLVAVKVSAAGVVSVDGSGSTQPVSGTVTANQGGTWNINDVSGTISLPTGAATSAKQDSQTALLTTIDTDTGSIATSTASIDTKTPALGQAAMAASVPVVIASDQSAIPITGTATVSGTVAATQSGTWTVQPGDTPNTVAWKVDGSAVTQPVSGTVTANAGTGTFTTNQVASTTGTFQDGSIAFGALTTSYATVITAGGDLKNVTMRNNTNAVVLVSLDSGSTAAYTLDSGDAISLDLKPLGLRVPSGATLQAKYSGSAPTSGSIRINGVY